MTTRPFLGTVPTFRQAYPNLQSVRLEAIHHGDIPQEWQRKSVYSEGNLPSNISCTNPRCKQGGYDLNTVFVILTGSKDTHYESTIHCHGHEGSPKGRRRGDSCMNWLELKVDVTYNDGSK